MLRHELHLYAAVDAPAFPWQHSLGLISPLKIAVQETFSSAPAAAGTTPAQHDSFDAISPQALFGHPGRQGQTQSLTQTDQTQLLSFPVGIQQGSQQSSHSSLPSSQPGVAWSSAPGSGTVSQLGFLNAGMDRVGTTGSAFSAWAPSQAHSVQGNALLGTGLNLSGISGATPGSARGPTPWAQQGMAPPEPAAAPGVYQGALPVGFHAPAMSSPSLSGPFAARRPSATLPGIAPATVDPKLFSGTPELPSSLPGTQAFSTGSGTPAFATLLPHMPFMTLPPHLSGQWPLAHGLMSQAQYLPQLSRTAPPYPLGFAHLAHHLPYPLPTHHHDSVSTPPAYLQNPVQGSSHLPLNLPYHLPSYLPHPMQTLIPSQPPLLNPFGQLYTPAAGSTLQIKPEPGDARQAPNLLPQEQWQQQLQGQVMTQMPHQRHLHAAQHRQSASATVMTQPPAAARESGFFGGSPTTANPNSEAKQSQVAK